MPDPAKPNPPRPLTQIGSYRLVRPLGSGGMSSVFQAVHVESGHEVALKVLPRTLAKNSTMLQRFLQEAKSAESLEHPGIVAIYDRGVEAGRYYLVLEYIAGGDLHDRVRERGGLPVAEALDMVKGVAEALRYAANRGVIHRDIKPANILLTLDGQVKLADLGLALQIEDEDERVTRDGTTVGTVDYMAPEQARDSRATSVRSDIYSLGCTFFHLLAGSAPYSGGDVPEKLRRHAFEPPRDIRKYRGDVPDAVAKLIMRMCAKRPEQRFQDYDELLAALAKIDPAALPSAPLMALIDDDGDEGELPTIVPAGAKVPGGTTEHVPLMALIDDEPDPPRSGPTQVFRPKPTTGAEPSYGLVDLDSETTPARPQTKPERTPSPTEPRPPNRAGEPGVDLSELADIEDASAPARSVGRRRPVPVTSRDPTIFDPIVAPSPQAGFERGGGDDGDLKDWIIRGLLAGIAIVLVGFGIQQLIALQLSGSGTDSMEPAAGAEEMDPEAQPVTSVKPTAPIVTVASTSRTPWVEPPDPAAIAPPPEPSFPGVTEAAYAPEWARIDPPIAGPTVVVRQLDPSTDRDHAATLAKALDVVGGTTELADVGPFFESNLRLGNRPRHIRAKPGFRPIVVLQTPTNPQARTRTAILPLESDLILEGLDLIVPIKDVPANQTVLFELHDGTLLLRDCTITIVGPADRPFTIARLGDPAAPSATGTPRLRIERSLIRGPRCTPLDLAGVNGEALIARSVLLCGSGPAVIASQPSGSAGTPRRITWLRSVVATQGALLEGEPGSSGPTVQSRALGSTFARVRGGEPETVMLSSRSSLTAATARQLVDWSGDHNLYDGWPGWLTSATSPSTALVANLEAARRIWDGAEAQSRERSEPWPDSVGQGWSDADDLVSLAPEAAPTLARVARPTPFLRERGVTGLDRLRLPLSAPTLDQAVIFDVSAAPWNGDLGRFLADRPAPANRRWVIRVRGGGGVKPLSPIRLPEGTSLEIDVEPAPSGGDPLVWTPVVSHSEPFIATKGADLALYNVRVSVPATARLENLIRVENGRLHVFHSQLLAPDAASLTGPLVTVRAATTQPLPAVTPSLPGAELPVAQFRDSVLISGREALQAELGQGVIAFANCAVAGGGSALVLLPQKVSRSRFQADLWLDRCTLVAEQEAVRFGPWPGSGPGPDRPWLVSSRGTAFLDGFDRSGRDTRGATVLRADADAAAHGALVWQASGDAYELSSFLTLGSDPPVFNPRPDVHSGWVGFWGEGQIVRALGPSRATPGQPPAVRLRNVNLKPGRVRPEDLALESTRSGANIGAVIGAVPELPEPRVVVAPPPVSPPPVSALPRPTTAAIPRSQAQTPARQPATVKTNRPF